MTEKITLSEIESYLWNAANILRGPVDASDFKAYIFPLLFFKRISDIYDEEYEDALKESGGDEEYASYPEQHDYIIPEGAHWKNIREKTTNVGQAIQYSFREIEKANPDQLYGIFGDVNWSNKEKLSDEILINLIENFSSKTLSKKNVEPDMLGQAYEFLIKKFADLTNRKAGEFYTPRTIVHLMGSILKPKETDSIYDPACGSGGMLLEAYHYVKERNGDFRTLKIYGQEKNLTTSAIARINLFLHGMKDFQIVRGDTLRNPAFREGDKLAQFDVVIANPPFSLENWGQENWAQDPFGRNFAGVPPKSYGDFAWVQHMVKSMALPNGKMAVILPNGALSRVGTEAKIRKELIDKDLIETIIGLGPNLFYGTGISACILVLKLNKDISKRNKIYFIDASNLYKKGRNQNYFLEEHAKKVLALYDSYKYQEGTSKIIESLEIEKNEYNLSVSRYVKRHFIKEDIDLNKLYLEIKNKYKEFVKYEEEINNFLREYKIK